MKAIDYYNEYIENKQGETKRYRVVLALRNMLYEVQHIQEIRKATSNSAMISIFNEQNTKANSFIKKVNKKDNLGIKRDAFKMYVQEQHRNIATMIGW